MIQLISLIAVISTVIFVLRKYPEKIVIKKMAITAILLSVSLVMTLFSLPLFFLGGQVVIRFSQLVLILLGAALGPLYALIAGLSFDILNLLIRPLGAPYIGFTLNNIWVGLFAALTFKLLKDRSYKLKLKVLFTSSIAYTIYIIIVLMLFVTQKNLFELVDSFTFNMIKNVIYLSLLIITIIVVIFIYAKLKKVNFFKLSDDLILIIISAILVEFIVQGFFTPIWLYDIAKTPILVSMQIRAIKGGLMVFLNSFTGYAVYRAIIKKVV